MLMLLFFYTEPIINPLLLIFPRNELELLVALHMVPHLNQYKFILAASTHGRDEERKKRRKKAEVPR